MSQQSTDESRRRILQAGVGVAMYSATPVPSISFTTATQAVAAPLVPVRLPDCIYSGLFAGHGNFTYDMRYFFSEVAPQTLVAKLWAKSEYKPKDSSDQMIDFALRLDDVMPEIQNTPHAAAALKRFSIKSSNYFCYTLAQLMRAYSLDEVTLKQIDCDDHWKHIKGDLSSFKDVGPLSHHLIASRLIWNTNALLDALDVLDKKFKGTQIIEGKSISSVDYLVRCHLRDLKTEFNPFKETYKDRDARRHADDIETDMLIKNLTLQQKIEFLLEAYSNFTGFFQVAKSLKPFVPERAGVEIRKFMDRDDDFAEQSAESYAAMELRIKKLRRDFNRFFAQYTPRADIKTTPQALDVKKLPTVARVAAAGRSMFEGLKGAFSEIAFAVVPKEAEKTQSEDASLLAHQPADASIQEVFSPAQSAGKEEFVPLSP